MVQGCPIEFARNIERRWHRRFSTGSSPEPAQRSARHALSESIRKAPGNDNFARGRHDQFAMPVPE
jgi:hypothetical protein